MDNLKEDQSNNSIPSLLKEENLDSVDDPTKEENDNNSSDNNANLAIKPEVTENQGTIVWPTLFWFWILISIFLWLVIFTSSKVIKCV